MMRTNIRIKNVLDEAMEVQGDQQSNSFVLRIGEPDQINLTCNTCISK